MTDLIYQGHLFPPQMYNQESLSFDIVSSIILFQNISEEVKIKLEYCNTNNVHCFVELVQFFSSANYYSIFINFEDKKEYVIYDLKFK